MVVALSMVSFPLCLIYDWRMVQLSLRPLLLELRPRSKKVLLTHLASQNRLSWAGNSFTSCRWRSWQMTSSSPISGSGLLLRKLTRTCGSVSLLLRLSLSLSWHVRATRFLKFFVLLSWNTRSSSYAPLSYPTGAHFTHSALLLLRHSEIVLCWLPRCPVVGATGLIATWSGAFDPNNPNQDGSVAFFYLLEQLPACKSQLLGTYPPLRNFSASGCVALSGVS